MYGCKRSKMLKVKWLISVSPKTWYKSQLTTSGRCPMITLVDRSLSRRKLQTLANSTTLICRYWCTWSFWTVFMTSSIKTLIDKGVPTSSQLSPVVSKVFSTKIVQLYLRCSSLVKPLNQKKLTTPMKLSNANVLAWTSLKVSSLTCNLVNNNSCWYQTPFHQPIERL